MAPEVRTNRGKAVPVGLGLLMERNAEQPGHGKGQMRQVPENRLICAKSGSGN